MAKKQEAAEAVEEVVAELVAVDERKPSGDVVNSRLIEWPLDEYGFTTDIRAAGIEAVSRIRGDEARLDIFITTLKVLGEHARAKIISQRAEIEADRIAAEALAAAEEAAEKRRREENVRIAQERLEAAQAALEAATGGDA